MYNILFYPRAKRILNKNSQVLKFPLSSFFLDSSMTGLHCAAAPTPSIRTAFANGRRSAPPVPCVSRRWARFNIRARARQWRKSSRAMRTLTPTSPPSPLHWKRPTAESADPVRAYIIHLIHKTSFLCIVLYVVCLCVYCMFMYVCLCMFVRTLDHMLRKGVHACTFDHMMIICSPYCTAAGDREDELLLCDGCNEEGAYHATCLGITMGHVRRNIPSTRATRHSIACSKKDSPLPCQFSYSSRFKFTYRVTDSSFRTDCTLF